MPACEFPDADKLCKVRPFMESLQADLTCCYSPHKEQAIDETLIKYKGRTSLKQHMPTTTGISEEQFSEVQKRKKDGTLENVACPPIVSAYNCYMGGADKNNQINYGINRWLTFVRKIQLV